MIRKTAFYGFAILAVAASGSLFTVEASAKGCNGVVNQLEWGCAAWDNNNGPDYPHYKKPASAAAAQPAAAQPAARAPNPAIATPNGGAGLVAAGAGNAVSKNGNGLVAAGAGNAVQKNASGLVAAGAGNAVQK
jgi:hypothetical protein